MNKEILETQWVQIRQLLRDKFSSLTEEDIRQINGHYDELVVKLQQRYGYTREEAEDRIRNWNFDRFTNTTYEDKAYREDKIRSDEGGSSLFNWFIALIIPLALLSLLYMNMNKAQDAVTTPAVVQEQVATETPADRALATNVRNAIIDSPGFASIAQNITVTSKGGAVTLNGTVPSNDFKQSFETIAKNYAGVTQVINNLKVE